MATVTDTDIVRIGAKLYAENPGVIVADDYVPLFHGWIQRRVLDGTPIDVADYKHVPDGPGIMLIGHEADRALDSARAAPASSTSASGRARGALEERFAAAIEAADRTAAEIEDDPAAAGVRFGRDEILLRVNDRLRAPNDDATLEELRPAIVAALGTVRPGRDAGIARVDGRPEGPPHHPGRLS